ASSSPSSSPSASSTGKTIEQWATSATATSNYGETAGSPWNASNATGVSAVNLCGDDGRAWASLKKTTVDTLTLKYKTPVIPSQIDVFESYNPGYVTSVVVSGSGQKATVYTAKVEKTTQCPKTLTIPVTDVPFPINTIAVTVDQTTLDNWAEIDAVRLTGTP
ncbi:MAG: hypothetical protein WCI74_10175, partial [Actinomycetes bacterium]